MNTQFNNLQTKKYDLEERTARFAEKIIDLVKQLPMNPINRPLIEQLVSSSGSMGANYCEANEAESRKDFIHKIGIVKKETKESKYWIRLLIRANKSFEAPLEELKSEAQELLLIFSKILITSRNGLKI
jgi:four helix bundle protein